MSQLLEELKRRNVVRVAIAYLIAGWLVLQIADLVLENIAAPEWIMQVFLLIFGLGLPLVLIFSWAYELTPEGLKREREVDRSQSITSNTGRKLNQVTIGLLIAVLVIVGLERTLSPDSSPATEVVTSDLADNSIAVLAFEDLSPEGDQAYFAEGLSEELLNVLAQVDDGMGPAVERVGQLLIFGHRHIGIERVQQILQRQDSFDGQGATGKKAPQIPGRLSGCLRLGGIQFRPERQFRRFLQVDRKIQVAQPAPIKPICDVSSTNRTR